MDSKPAMRRAGSRPHRVGAGVGLGSRDRSCYEPDVSWREIAPDHLQWSVAGRSRTRAEEFTFE